jgi:hypothetical protein
LSPWHRRQTGREYRVEISAMIDGDTVYRNRRGRRRWWCPA